MQTTRTTFPNYLGDINGSTDSFLLRASASPFTSPVVAPNQDIFPSVPVQSENQVNTPSFSPSPVTQITTHTFRACSKGFFFLSEQ